MYPFFDMLVGLAVFGGLGALGLLVLLIALFAAKRTGSVIACAFAAALLFAMQIGFYAFWEESSIVWTGALIALALVAGFLRFKLTHREQPTDAPAWWRDGAKIAAILLVAYAIYDAGFIILRQRYPYAGQAELPSIFAWLPVLTAVALAWGLREHYRWAWYAAVCLLAASMAWTAGIFLRTTPSLEFLLVSTPVGAVFLLKLAAFVVLLATNARKLCSGYFAAKQ